MKSFESLDPSMPSFKYSEAEREDFKKRGMTNTEIDQKEALVNLKLAEKQMDEELEEAA